MNRSRLIVATLVALIAGTALAALCPASAAAAGGPILVTGGDGERGIASADGEFNYVVLTGSETTVAKVAIGTGEVNAWMNRSEGLRFALPQVAADGGVAGLSADGGTLVLISQGGPINRAELLVLGTNKLRVRSRIELKGQYGFDAVAPDGRTAYVVEYPRPFRYDRYRVLKLDLKTGRLAKEPVADEDVGLDEETEEAEEAAGEGEMRGLALSRIASDDGRWAYTLYDGGGDVPFIHALDTVGDRAVCIFLPQLESLGRREIGAALIGAGPEAGTLSVVGDGRELARIDTATFAVTTPADDVNESGAAVPLAIAVALTVVAIASIALIRRRRRAS